MLTSIRLTGAVSSVLLVLTVSVGAVVASTTAASATAGNNVLITSVKSVTPSPYMAAITPCGGDKDTKYTPSIDIGCQGKGNPIMDTAFAIIRFLSNGAGLVLIGSLVYAGIQYSLSRGDPQSTSMAITRMRSVVIALFIFIFAYAMLNFVVPGQVLK